MVYMDVSCMCLLYFALSSDLLCVDTLHKKETNFAGAAIKATHVNT